jgi:uncharacterized protein YndB with AHSA1/START domain
MSAAAGLSSVASDDEDAGSGRAYRGIVVRMNEVHVNVYIHAPREQVFAALSDHAAFLRVDGPLVKATTRIVREGERERNGLGCLREARGAIGMRFVEEITAWEPPSFFEYRIVDTSLPLQHRGGRIELTERGAGTEVDWTTRFKMTVPLGKGLMGSLSEGLSSVLFTTFLLAAKARLEGTAKA